MTMYYCKECGDLIDNDIDPCESHPNIENGLICPDCVLMLEEEKLLIEMRAGETKDDHPFLPSLFVMKHGGVA